MFSEKYRTLSKRFFALLIDGVILLLPTYFESFLLVPGMPVPIVVIGLFLAYFCYSFYSIYLHAVYGQTLGKMFVKIKVVDISENPIDFRQSFLREFPFLLLSFLLFFSEISQVLSVGITDDYGNTNFDVAIISIIWILLLVALLTALFNEKRRAIHDYLAGTVVIRTNI